MKLPNGYGSITKLSGKRRKPYRVRITTDYDDSGNQIRTTLGYAENYTNALKMLADYHGDPYDLNYKDLTFSYIWENDVFPKLETLVINNKMSDSNVKCLKSAYLNHCQELHKQKIIDIKKKQLQMIIDTAELGRTGKGHIKTVCKKVFDCAIIDYELPLKNNPADTLYAGERSKNVKHIPYTLEERNLLWDNINNDIIKSIILMCYTGTRPNELFDIEIKNIHIDERYMIGGSKTEAGINRIIPIHKRILPLVKYFISSNDEYPFKSLIKCFTYNKYRLRFNKIIEDLKMNHTPYDARHTFATMMKQANTNEYILKLIMGHSIQDLTEKVYTHRSIKEIVEEVNKID